MNHRLTPISQAVQCALIASAAAGAGLTATVANAEDASIVEEVIVTGSRLRRDRDFVEVSPVATIGMDEIQNLGYLTLEQTVNRMPQLKPDTTSSTNQYGGAAMSADLRGLGPSRTLVLVDGRRYIPAQDRAQRRLNSGIADLASIPDMLLESVEIVTGGASAVYGSDALAGVVNFRLRDDIRGARIRYQRGESDRGDGETERADFVLGAGTEDGSSNMALAFTWSERGTILGAQRKFSEVPFWAIADGTHVPFGAGWIPGNRVSLQPSQFPLVNGVDLSNSDGSCPGPIQGVRFDAGSQPVPFCRPTDQYNYAATNYLLRPIERYQVSVIGNHEFNERVEAYGQAFYVKYQQDYQMAALAAAPTSFGYPSGTVVIPDAVNNPLFTPVLQDFWRRNAHIWDQDGDGNYTVTGNGRRFLEFGPRHFDFNTDAFLITAGMRGNFDVGDRNWTWDGFIQHSQNQSMHTLVGVLSRSALTLGLDPVINEDGSVTCRTPIRGCVPVNIYGTDTLTPEMAEYLQTESASDYRFQRRVAGASVAGDLFDLPAGTVATAFGAEYRKESQTVTPNDALLRGDISTIPSQIEDGDYDLYELFGEARVPILRDQLGLQGLAVEGAFRFADYSTVGQVITWSTSLDMDVNEQLKVRAGYSRAIRAPNLDELLKPVTAAFRPVNDPCTAAQNPSQATKDLCSQQGVPSQSRDTLVDVRTGYDLIGGGNPELDEEEADTLTVGFVFSPSFLSGLTMSVDYYDIKMTNAIDQVDGQGLINDCFANLDNSLPSCQALVRNQQGNLVEVIAPLLNLAERNVDGLDLSATYRFDSLPNWMSLPNRGATLDVQTFWSWQFTNDRQQLPSLPVIDCAGYYAGTCSSGPIRPTPGFRGLLRVNWTSGPVRLSPEMNYVGSLKLHPDANPNEVGTQEPVVIVNLNGSWDFWGKTSINFGINNLFDKQPPIWAYQAAGDLNVNVHLYDPVGRSYFVGVSTGF